MGLFSKADKINASELSDRIKPIFITAFDICREFGFEEEKYFNFLYKDKSIIIRHSGLQKYISGDAFSPGKFAYIDYKGRRVFDCTIKLNGNIKLKVFETGEWRGYLSSLDGKRKITLSARKLLDVLYEFGAYHLHKKVPGGHDNLNGYSFSNGRISIACDLFGKNWVVEDNKIKVKFARNEKKNVASSAIITFMGETVYNAVHFFPSSQKPANLTSNTRCEVYKKGNWETYLMDVLNYIKALYRV